MKHKKLEDAALLQGATNESKVIKHQGGFVWDGAVRRIYKDEPGSWRSVTRTSLVGGSDDVPVPFHLRYFEVQTGGFSSLEKHAHQHVIMVVRGHGEVVLGTRREALSFGDVVYIAPWEVHQFCNPQGPEPLGFLCMVPAQRDRPVAVKQDE